MSKARVNVESVVVAGLPKAVVARQYGVSRQWVHQLVDRYVAGGWDAIEARSKRPHSNPRAIDDATVARILALRADLAQQGFDAGASTIAAHLVRETGASPAIATIWNILSRSGVITPQPRKRPAAPTSGSRRTCRTSVGSPTSPTGRWPTAPTPRS
jgi:transposase